MIILNNPQNLCVLAILHGVYNNIIYINTPEHDFQFGLRACVRPVMIEDDKKKIDKREIPI